MPKRIGAKRAPTRSAPAPMPPALVPPALSLYDQIELLAARWELIASATPRTATTSLKVIAECLSLFVRGMHGFAVRPEFLDEMRAAATRVEATTMHLRGGRRCSRRQNIRRGGSATGRSVS